MQQKKDSKMDEREKQIRKKIADIKRHLRNTPPKDWGYDELIVHTWGLYELVGQLQDLTGADVAPVS
jgi:hypothetical protein